MLDILQHIAKADAFIVGLSVDAFINNDMCFYAVTRCLEIISEASRRLPPELKARNPSIPWQDIAAAGNIYRHDYEDVAARRVWDTLAYHLKPLQIVVAAELSALDSQPGPTGPK